MDSATPISNPISGFAASIRTAHWWQYKAAPLMGFVYLFISEYSNVGGAFINILISAVVILGIAGIGYVINDLYDIEFDKAAGKPNRIGTLSYLQRGLLILFLLLASSVPWLVLPFDRFTLTMVLFQFFLYIIYSHPLIRFKEKHFLGVICDALYGHAVPAIIAMYTFYQMQYFHIPYVPTFVHFEAFLALSFVWLFFKGARNIIIHQLEDRKNDKLTSFNTFVLWYGPLRSLQLINKVIMPIEILLFGAWLTLLSINSPMFAVVSCFFLLVSYFKFSGWNLAYQPHRQSWFKFLYFLNDVYEDWLPLLAVIMLATHDVRMLALVALHLALFPGLVFRLLRDVKLSLQSIRQGRISEQQRIIIK